MTSIQQACHHQVPVLGQGQAKALAFEVKAGDTLCFDARQLPSQQRTHKPVIPDLFHVVFKIEFAADPLSSPVLPGVSETRKSDGKANDSCGKFGAKVLCTALWEIQRQAETVGDALLASRASSAGAQARHEHRRVALRFGGDAGITDVEVWRTFAKRASCTLDTL